MIGSLSRRRLIGNANVPQVKKTWQTRRADDLSLKMLLLLMTGVALWVVYGARATLSSSSLMAQRAARRCATLALLATILYFKLRYSQHGCEVRLAAPQVVSAGPHV
jgi:MtN3 and saliva related transmembrane protein